MSKTQLGVYFEKVFEDGQDADVTLLAFHTQFPLHRIILKRSEYFRALLAVGKWKEANLEVIRLDIPDDCVTKEGTSLASPALLLSFLLQHMLKTWLSSSILRYCALVAVLTQTHCAGFIYAIKTLYNDDTYIPGEHLRSALAACSFFQLRYQIDRIGGLLARALTPRNCVDLYQLAVRYYCTPLIEAAKPRFVDFVMNVYLDQDAVLMNPTEALNLVSLDEWSLALHSGLPWAASELSVYRLVRHIIDARLSTVEGDSDVDVTPASPTEAKASSTGVFASSGPLGTPLASTSSADDEMLLDRDESEESSVASTSAVAVAEQAQVLPPQLRSSSDSHGMLCGRSSALSESDGSESSSAQTSPETTPTKKLRRIKRKRTGGAIKTPLSVETRGQKRRKLDQARKKVPAELVDPIKALLEVPHYVAMTKDQLSYVKEDLDLAGLEPPRTLESFLSPLLLHKQVIHPWGTMAQISVKFDLEDVEKKLKSLSQRASVFWSEPFYFCGSMLCLAFNARLCGKCMNPHISVELQRISSKSIHPEMHTDWCVREDTIHLLDVLDAAGLEHLDFSPLSISFAENTAIELSNTSLQSFPSNPRLTLILRHKGHTDTANTDMPLTTNVRHGDPVNQNPPAIFGDNGHR